MNLVSSHSAYNPVMAFIGSDLWTAWQGVDASGVEQIVVKYNCNGIDTNHAMALKVFE